MFYLPALAWPCIGLQQASLCRGRPIFLFQTEQECLKSGLRCLACTGPTGQVSNAGKSVGGLGLPLGMLLLSLAGAARPNAFACRFLVGGCREVQLQEALLAWGLFSCRCTAFPVGRARLSAGFLPCRAAGRGGECLRRGTEAASLLVWFSFPACCGSCTAQGLRRAVGRAWEPAGRSSWLVSVLPARGSVHWCSLLWSLCLCAAGFVPHTAS